MDPDWIVTLSRARAKARAKPCTTLALAIVAAQLTWSRVIRRHRKSVTRWVRLLHLIPRVIATPDLDIQGLPPGVLLLFFGE